MIVPFLVNRNFGSVYIGTRTDCGSHRDRLLPDRSLLVFRCWLGVRWLISITLCLSSIDG